MLQWPTTLCAGRAAVITPGIAGPFAPGVPVCVASISMLSGKAMSRSMNERVGSTAVGRLLRIAANSGTFVVKRRVTSMTARCPARMRRR